MDVHVSGRPDEIELAALLAVLAGRVGPAAPLPLARWRSIRRAAVRRTAQQTR